MIEGQHSEYRKELNIDLKS